MDRTVNTRQIDRPTACTREQMRLAVTANPSNLAPQGGGAHGAFAWGVLDRLPEDDRIAVDAISATSAGAMNAVAMAIGVSIGGREGAPKARGILDRDLKRGADLFPHSTDAVGALARGQSLAQ